MSLVLRVGRGVELAGDVPDGWLPPGLTDEARRELAEWHSLAPAGDGAAHDVLRARAEQLAARIAAETSTVVRVVAGEEVLTFGAPDPSSAPGPPPPEPTPWGTGLTLALATGAVVLVAFLALYSGLAALSPLVAAGVLAVVVVLLVPTGMRYRVVPVWRWVVHGAAAGVVLGWVWLLLTALT